MALAKQVITLDFGFGGIDQKTDEKLVVRTRLAELYDARFNKAGRVDRRNGQALLGTPPAQSLRLLSNDGALLVAGGAFDSSAFVYRADVNGSITLADGHGQQLPAAEITVEPMGPIRRLLPAGGAASTATRYDRADGETMYAIATMGRSSTGGYVVFVDLRDTASNNLVKSFTAIAGVNPKLISNPVGGNHWVMLSRQSTGLVPQLHVFSATYGLTVLTSPTHASFTGASIVATADSNTANYVTPGVPTARLWFANILSATQLVLTSCAFPTSASPATYGTVTVAGTNFGMVCLSEFNNRSITTPSSTVFCRMTFQDKGVNKGVYSGVYGDAGSTLFSPVLVDSTTVDPCYAIAGANYHTYPTGIVGVGFYPGVVGTQNRIFQFNASNTPVQLDTVQNLDMVSTWMPASNSASSTAGQATSSAAYGWFAYRSDTTQNTAFLLRMSDNRLNASESVPSAIAVGRVFYGYGPAQVELTNTVGAPSMQYLGGGNFVTPLSSKQRQSAPGDAQNDIYDVYGVRHTSTTISKGWHSASVRNDLIVTGGHGVFVNGAEGPLPLAALLAPNIISVSATVAGGGGLMTAGSYAISGVLEYTDTNGRVHRSAPALPKTVALSGTNLTIELNYENYTVPDGLGFGGRLRFVPYRTLVNESQVYYRSESKTGTNLPLTSLISSLTVFLTAADATVGTQPALYTVGGVFPDYTPSAPIAIASNGRRCLCVEGDNPTFVLESKPIVAGYGPSFMQGVGKYVAAGGARIYALASYLDKWFAFKEHGIFVAQGDGADVTGQNDTLSEFQPLVSRFGCTSPRSVVTTANGIVFASVKGFYMIGADLGAQYIGASVEDYTSAVIDAAYDELNDTVYYLLADGTQLVLTFFTTEAGVEPRWSVDQNSGGSSVQVINGLRYLLPTATPSTTPAVYRETAGTYIDANVSTTQVPAFKATSAWVPMGGIQGFGRVYKALVIGTFPAAQAATTVLVRIGFNYSSTYAESHTILSTAMIANGNNVQFEIRPATQKCEAIRFEISQPETTVAGAGLALNQIQLTVGIKSGDNKIAATARAVGS